MSGGNAVCLKYGPGATVAVDLRCPRFNCRREYKGTALVVNEHGVREPMPSKCACGIRLDVVRIVDIESEPSP